LKPPPAETCTSRSAAETVRIAKAYAKSLAPGDCVALVGGLGAGKTTFVRGLAEGLQVEATVSSPTYLIVQEYPGPVPLFHMDAYRLGGADDLLDVGFEHYLGAGGVVAIEWGDKVSALLPPHCRWIYFEILPDHTHRITLRPHVDRAVE